MTVILIGLAVCAACGAAIYMLLRRYGKDAVAGRDRRANPFRRNYRW